MAVMTARDSRMNREANDRWRFAAGEPIAPGRFALELLGGGHRYEAYVCWDERLHATVVAKLLRPGLVDDDRSRAMLAAEADALRGLQHPVLVRSFGAVLEGERPHLVLEHLEGPRLSTLVRRFGPLAAEQIIPLAWRLISALAYLAAEDWVHLDVKPRNIMMTAVPRHIDLSVARPVEAARQIRQPTGTDAYMAPEQCDPARFGQIGPTSDVWGLGATLYEALTGRAAFAPDGVDRFPQLRSAPAPMPSKAPPALAAAIGACLQGDPAARPGATELGELLEPLADWSARAVRRLR
jgi:serine/threonine protein kinase